ncbi:MAG: TIGR03915 family putative DNA repair protein, partial [Defluviitaleaceae bacterium]|nr:TIGR03915 family putative DNA repair protein [Defluviitaleaceae bacterium]
DIAYLYDGSFDGLMCCVYESYYKKELPFAIFTYEERQETLFEIKEIETDQVAARRVEDSIAQRISKEALKLVHLGFLSRATDRELAILNFLRLGYKVGQPVTDMLANDAVRTLTKNVQGVQGEGHLYTGFLRFSEYNGALAAIFEPKNFVLPIVAAHFCNRFPSEHFLIYDKKHKYVFIHQDGEKTLMPLENLELPPDSTEEQQYKALWKQFYKTIAIEGRINPKLRQGNMPKHYWKHMTEFMED